MKTFCSHTLSAVGVILAVYMLCAVSVAAARPVNPMRFLDRSGLLGDWTGESLCQQKGTACKDEKVVYHIAAAKEPGKVTIKADKIVGGKPVTMGISDWDYNEEKQTLTWNNWKLKIDGDRMEGTLVGTDGRLIRKMWLKKATA